MGQFATPPALARAVVEAALGWVPPASAIRFLDPAFGTGAFLSALLAAVDSTRLAALTGFELDPHYGAPAQALWRDSGLALTLADFTRVEVARGQANLIVCNPPYVRHHHLEPADKARLVEVGERATGLRLSALAGLYAHFMLLAEPWAAPGALAAWLVPSEFMDVGYGAGIRRYLTERVSLLRVHRFDPGDLQFGDALVSSAVLWWRHVPPPSGHSATFSRGGTIAEPDQARTVTVAALAASAKWTQFPGSHAGLLAAEPGAGPVLGDFFQIQRGIATGDNRFFILSPEQVAAHRLPPVWLRPILPGPRHLPAGVSEILADADGAPLLARPRFLLDCRCSEAELADQPPELARYLAAGAATTGQRYLCRHRRPWYAQERRAPAPLLCTYMGRPGARADSGTGSAPFRFIRNRSQALAPNVYLALQPRPRLAAALARDDGLLDRLWQWLNRVDGAALVAEGRVYGGGLHKLEPRELARLPVPATADGWPGAGFTEAAQGSDCERRELTLP